MGVGETFRPHPSACSSGRPGAGREPRTPTRISGGGAGRQACRQCGECMTGAVTGPRTHCSPTTSIWPNGPARSSCRSRRSARSSPGRAAGGSSGPRGRRSSVRGAPRRPGRDALTAGQVVLAAGALGTQKLLQTMALEGKLPELSLRLGELTRTNSESLLGRDCPEWPSPPRFQPRCGNNLLVFTPSPGPMPSRSATGMGPT